jgi:hypothetical protein
MHSLLGPSPQPRRAQFQKNRQNTHKDGSIEGVETPAIVSLGVLHLNLEPLLHELEQEECKEQSSRISRHINFRTPLCVLFDV